MLLPGLSIVPSSDHTIINSFLKDSLTNTYKKYNKLIYFSYKFLSFSPIDSFWTSMQPVQSSFVDRSNGLTYLAMDGETLQAFGVELTRSCCINFRAYCLLWPTMKNGLQQVKVGQLRGFCCVPKQLAAQNKLEDQYQKLECL